MPKIDMRKKYNLKISEFFLFHSISKANGLIEGIHFQNELLIITRPFLFVH